jgi:hypothetical protein
VFPHGRGIRVVTTSAASSSSSSSSSSVSMLAVAVSPASACSVDVARPMKLFLPGIGPPPLWGPLPPVCRGLLFSKELPVHVCRKLFLIELVLVYHTRVNRGCLLTCKVESNLAIVGGAPPSNRW